MLRELEIHINAIDAFNRIPFHGDRVIAALHVNDGEQIVRMDRNFS